MLEVFETEVDFVVMDVMDEFVGGGLVRLDNVLVVRDEDFSVTLWRMVTRV